MSVAAPTVERMFDFHPWRAFRDSPLTLRRARLPDRMRAGLIGDVVWMDDRLLQAERRCAVLHEMRHHQLGHEGPQPSAVEAQVRQWVARTLIPMELLLDKLAWTEDLDELASECWVDRQTLMARLDSLTEGERAQVVALSERLERGA